VREIIIRAFFYVSANLLILTHPEMIDWAIVLAIYENNTYHKTTAIRRIEIWFDFYDLNYDLLMLERLSYPDH